MPGTNADLTDVVRDAGEAKAAERGLEVKSANYGTKVLDPEQGIAEMIVAVTGIQDHVNDIIEPGAIQPGLKSRWPKGIWHHTWEQPICKTLEAEELMPGDKRLPETLREGTPWPSEAGAFLVKGQFNLETQRGREAFSDIKFFGGDQEYSIGYKVGQAHRTKDGIRHIKSMTIPEYSPVLFGAMSSTSTISTKSAAFADDEKSGFVNLPGSLEERLDSIEDALEVMLPGQGVDLAKSAVRVVGTYADRVIFAIGDDEKSDQESYFESPYFVNEKGETIVMSPHAVDVSKTEGEKSNDPLIAALEIAGEMQAQVKAGRVLSGANKAKVRAAVDALQAVMDAAGIDADVVADLGEGKADPMAKKPHAYKAGDDGKCATCGTGSGNPMHHVKSESMADQPHEFVASQNDDSTCSVCGLGPDAECHTDVDPNADDATKVDASAKPHPFVPGPFGKCKVCGKPKDDPIHNTKADPNDMPNGGPDAMTHEYAEGKGGLCSKCGMVKLNQIHLPPYSRPYNGPIDTVASDMHKADEQGNIHLSPLETLELERRHAGL